jgi:hypothetical protein
MRSLKVRLQHRVRVKSKPRMRARSPWTQSPLAKRRCSPNPAGRSLLRQHKVGQASGLEDAVVAAAAAVEAVAELVVVVARKL